MGKNKRKHIDENHAQPAKRQRQTQNADVVDQLPKPTIQLSAIPAFSPIHARPEESLPVLPAVKDETLAGTPFNHRSLGRDQDGVDTSYERLEFLGDAYLDLFASRILFHRFALRIPPRDFSRLLQLRELLTNNETLAGFAERYRFHERLKMAHKEDLDQETHSGRRFFTKTLGDCFEAFIAASVLDGDIDGAGFRRTESWMAALWEPKIQKFLHEHRLTETKPSAELADYHESALEFLGSSYVELFATRLIFTRLHHLTAGRMSQLTEQLIKSETLAHLAQQLKLPPASNIDNKAYRTPKDHYKALAIAYRAHIGTEIFRNDAHAPAVEDMMVHLWAPKLLEEIQSDPILNGDVGSDGGRDEKRTYNQEAKALLQKRVPTGNGVKVEYETYKASVELKGTQLGQTRHFIACYLSGYGYTRKLLGKGEGKSKAEAGNWAAIDAMYGDSKGVVEECAAKILEAKERKRAEMGPKE